MEERDEPEAGARTRRLRTDHRTGKPVLLRDAAFWQEHERRRLEQGLSLRAYCEANGLAISTFRLRMKPGSRKSATRTVPAKKLPQFVALQAPVAEALAHQVEVLAGKLTLRLHGAAAEKVLQRVLEKLA